MTAYSVHVRARPDCPSRLLWLVKWLLLIPHSVVLVVLWVAFIALTIVAYIAVLFTGRYPRGIFNFNVGVLRWSWRVGYYGYQVLGTDRYPPFSLAPDPDYPADLWIDYSRPDPELPAAGRVAAGPAARIPVRRDRRLGYAVYRDGNLVTQTGLSLVTVAVLIAAVGLTFTGDYPRGLYDLLTGIARWSLRVLAYVALLTRQYPPFRLDQGGDEPVDPDGPPPPGSGTVAPWISPSAPLAPPPPPRPSAGATVARVVSLLAGVLLMLGGARRRTRRRRAARRQLRPRRRRVRHQSRPDAHHPDRGGGQLRRDHPGRTTDGRCAGVTSERCGSPRLPRARPRSSSAWLSSPMWTGGCPVRPATR